jgi:septum formation protein
VSALVLASGSARRQRMLEELGLTFTVDPADIDETPGPDESAAAYVERLAREKSAAVSARHPGALVLGADTSVVVDGEIFGKPIDDTDATKMLRRLSGRVHQVLTGVAIAGAVQRSRHVATAVRFRELNEDQLRWYVNTREPFGKAGGYAVQGLAGSLIERVEGSISNVIGLPLVETLEMLDEAGFLLPWSARR